MKSWRFPLMICALVVFFIFILRSAPDESSDALWEEIPTPQSSARMMRTPTPHGWLVAYKSAARSLVFVPDEKHEWDISLAKNKP